VRVTADRGFFEAENLEGSNRIGIRQSTSAARLGIPKASVKASTGIHLSRFPAAPKRTLTRPASISKTVTGS
jgi:hypothetical protein